MATRPINTASLSDAPTYQLQCTRSSLFPRLPFTPLVNPLKSEDVRMGNNCSSSSTPMTDTGGSVARRSSSESLSTLAESIMSKDDKRKDARLSISSTTSTLVPSSPTLANEKEKEGTPPTSSTTVPSNRAAYPWSVHDISLLPLELFVEPKVFSPSSPSPNPFPRYGLSAPSTLTSDGQLLLFGGLKHGTPVPTNELYSLSLDCAQSSSRDAPVDLKKIETAADVPSPRVGHGCARLNDVMAVWGGDTSSSLDAPDLELDSKLYLYNMVSREWTRIKMEPDSATPKGRYGHTLSAVGPMLYVFGGQREGTFFNDMWSFDLRSLRDYKTNPLRWELVHEDGAIKVPARRTGHVSVSDGDKIYIFGGTDGQYHYNDTWMFCTSTRTWTELSCIGYIPSAREGHAAAAANGRMYIFGGRGVNGEDLADLAAFCFQKRRWYMFQNMGPAPCARSGHAMATFGSRVVVVGGESSIAQCEDDKGRKAKESCSKIHILDTRHIKYPS
ncbi:galactose oxidase [Schizopora paradoxa]|uniref:Galactose oxidase n=1 Tax=Schizopora paradoxa TaxID=27342 RepID=A0A0H2R9T6_9AGAM|nr:galactose oxidase [Schizopora paradoxa]